MPLIKGNLKIQGNDDGLEQWRVLNHNDASKVWDGQNMVIQNCYQKKNTKKKDILGKKQYNIVDDLIDESSSIGNE